tara:strand:+ start:6971 stop:9646 length:2676 start_codon:yes stop_codon:yes gene_type:complete
MDKMKKLFLIDGMAIIYRAHFAMIKNPLLTKDGRHTSAIFGFLNSILKMIKDEKPEYLAIVLDSKTKTFRHELFTEYKANRQKMPDELVQQLSPLYEILNLMNIPLVSLDGYEADDLIGTIAKKAEIDDFKTYIMTGDKDMMQLVTDKVFVYSPGNRFKPTTTYTVDKVKDRWGVDPSQFIDYLAMVGDSSDNVPGVEGIGAKSAVKLIQEYETLEEILEKGHEASNKRIREGILKGKDLAYLSKKLVTIDCNVPYEFHLENFIIKNISNQLVVDMLKDLELNSLISKITSENNSEDNTKDIDREYHIVDNNNKLVDMIKEINGKDVISFDITANQFNYKTDVIDGISFSISGGSGWYVPIHSNSNSLAVFDLLRDVFENRNHFFCSSNIKQHIILLSNYNIKLNDNFYDITLGEHLLSPEKHSYNLDFMAIDYCNRNIKFNPDFFKLNKQLSTLSELDNDSQTIYCCERSDIILQVYLKQRDRLISENLYDYYQNIEKPLIEVLSLMEKQGVYVDSEMLETLSSNLSVEIDMITNQIFSISGYEFNINSPQQLAVLIFDELKLKEIKKRSTAMEVLKVLRNYHPIADLVLKYRHLNKLKNTYLDAFPKYINKKTNRIHSSFHQATTITGRLSSSNPNFQNIPIRTDYGKEIRKAFCSDNGNKIISADYSQVELRIMAEFSKEPNLIDAFNNNIDIHTRTAALINNISENNVDDNQRRTAKVVNFGIMYGAGPFRMSQELGISIKESKDLIETYFCTYPRIKEYMDNTIAFANKYGYVKTLLGRKKNINLGSHLSVQMQKAEERALINMPIQGTAAELIKVAMINIFHKFKNNNLNTKMILQIHDELIFESSINEQEIAKKIIVSEMEKAMSLSIPLKVSCNTGDNWYEAH